MLTIAEHTLAIVLSDAVLGVMLVPYTPILGAMSCFSARL